MSFSEAIYLSNYENIYYHVCIILGKNRAKLRHIFPQHCIASILIIYLIWGPLIVELANKNRIYP